MRHMSRKVNSLLVIQTWDGGEHNAQTIATMFSCHRDTVMRILVASDRVQTETEKYLPARQSEKWTRPCSRCGSTKPRAKGLFFCAKCKEAIRRDAGGIDDVEFSWPG